MPTWTVWNLSDLPVWNHWLPSVPAVFRLCWSCRIDPSHSKWCNVPHWTPKWGGVAGTAPDPPEPEAGPQWWCGRGTGLLKSRNTPKTTLNSFIFLRDHLLCGRLEFHSSAISKKTTLTFGSTDNQPQLRTHRHTHHLVVVSCQHCSGSRIVTYRKTKSPCVSVYRTLNPLKLSIYFHFFTFPLW